MFKFVTKFSAPSSYEKRAVIAHKKPVFIQKLIFEKPMGFWGFCEKLRIHFCHGKQIFGKNKSCHSCMR
jgi:hypothetical protein